MITKQNLDVRVKHEIMEQHFPGIAAGVYKGGKETEYISYGYTDLSQTIPIRKDTIFRLYSMSKPICATAAWILIERGSMRLSDPVSAYLPEYKDMFKWAGGIVTAAESPILVKDLLNMTAGLTYDDNDEAGRQTGQLFQEIYQKMEEGNGLTVREIARRLAKQPLAHEPGSAWRYGLCADVLGAVMEKASGEPLKELYEKEIFAPLGMKDTGFYVPDSKKERFAPLYKQVYSENGCRLKEDKDYHIGLGDFLTPPVFESAGAGLVSTYQDYMRFGRMLANLGELDGIRLLSPETVLNFTKNQLNPVQTRSINFEHMKGYGYGNLMRVSLCGEEQMIPGNPGEFGWEGWCGPYMAVDCAQNQVIIIVLQVAAYCNWELIKDMRDMLL